MNRIIVSLCLFVVCLNQSGAFQFKIDKANLNYPTNEEQGQGEYYVPAYVNPYQAYLQAETYSPNRFAQHDAKQASDIYSRFPSLINPSVALNGQDVFSKYKNHKTKPRPNKDDLKKLLVSIKSLEDSNGERIESLDDYIRLASNQNARIEEPRPIPQHHTLAYNKPSTSGHKHGDGRWSPQLANSNTFRQTPQIYQAENMANSFNEILDVPDENMILNKKDLSIKPHVDTALEHSQQSSMNEPKIRRKLVTDHQPAFIQNSKSVVMAPKAYQQSIEQVNSNDSILSSLSDVYFVAIVACVSSVAIFSVIGAGYCFYKVQQSNKASADVEFPAYGVIGPVSRHDSNGAKCTSPPADHKLAQSAQMYHYHHQKQQMISTDKNANIPRNAGSDIESDEENEDGEYTVYECPGLAPTGEMEVKNPLFQDDLTPISSPSLNGAVVNKCDASKEASNLTESIKSQAKADKSVE